ncbi:hypothetical protein [Phenylobacterium sp.]|uniref:hypothetical protein n=1 Tax=Phenylobacterium sp. TaxID=1871053 RepID=UPI002F3EF4D4
MAIAMMLAATRLIPLKFILAGGLLFGVFLGYIPICLIAFPTYLVRTRYVRPGAAELILSWTAASTLMAVVFCVLRLGTAAIPASSLPIIYALQILFGLVCGSVSGAVFWWFVRPPRAI